MKSGRGRGSAFGGEEVGDETTEEAEEEDAEEESEEGVEDSTGVTGGRGEFDRELALIVPLRPTPFAGDEVRSSLVVEESW